MGHPVVHFEIGWRDAAKTQESYAKLFDWKMQAAGPAVMIAADGAGGIEGHITALGHEPHKYVTVECRWTIRRPTSQKPLRSAGRRWFLRSRFPRARLRGWPTRMATSSGCGSRSSTGFRAVLHLFHFCPKLRIS